MAMIKVSIIPLGTGIPSVSKYVARAVEVLQDEKDIKYELTAMGTIIEGDLDRLLTLARKMHETVFDAGLMRAVTIIEIDDRRDKTSSMSSKIESVKRELEH
ncbi:MAG: MTH1187 family thiamine-binding protein [Dehalococcoidales bacterium]|nr:MTH1187 family thiamine-binding protein [Dehalococcoidales bacterium]